MKKVMYGLLACTAVAIPVPGQAGAGREYDLELVRSSVRVVLAEFSRQTGLQTAFYPVSSAEEQIMVGPLAGHYTAEAALNKLLASSGLSFIQDNERTITVLVPNALMSERHGGRIEIVAPTKPEFVRLVDRRFEEQSSEKRPDVGLASDQQITDQGTDISGQPERRLQARESRDLEEVIVTAQRRAERLQDVPISISVLSGIQLDRSPSQGVTEALSRVPGVSVTAATQTGGSQLSVRGVSAAGTFAFGSSPIAYYLDSVPFGFVKTAIAPDASAYDLDRVEVLRGPQGTLYGASAQNGVVRVLTKDANLNETEFKARALTSVTQYGSENYRGDMAVNVPIIDGKLAARAVVGYQNLSGWIDEPIGKDANDAQLLNMRLKVNAKPTEKLSLGMSAWISRSDAGAPSSGDDNRIRGAVVGEPIGTDYNSFGFKFGYDFPGFSVLAMTSYLDFSLDSRWDTAFDGLNILTTNLDAKVFAQEINLTSTREGSWRWSLGGMYRDAEDRNFQARRTSEGVLTAGYVAPIDFTNLSESIAVFGEVTRLFLNGQVELTGGLRYFEDRVGGREDSRRNGAPAAQLLRTTRNFDRVSPRAVLTWHPGDQVTAYASYAEGFRSGSDQTPAAMAVAPTLAPTDPDNLKNYEIGVKTSLLDGRLSFDAALYYMDWQRVQTPFLVQSNGIFLSALVNAPSASGMGFDFGVTAKPIDALTLDFTYSVNGLTQDADVFAGPFLIFNKGERLNLSPEYTIGSSANYTFPLGGGGFEGRLSASANYTSRRDQRIFFAESVSVGSKPLFIAGTSFSIISPNHWTASLFVDNVNNEQDPVLPVPAGDSPYDAVRMRPRTAGVQFDYSFR